MWPLPAACTGGGRAGNTAAKAFPTSCPPLAPPWVAAEPLRATFAAQAPAAAGEAGLRVQMPLFETALDKSPDMTMNTAAPQLH